MKILLLVCCTVVATANTTWSLELHTIQILKDGSQSTEEKKLPPQFSNSYRVKGTLYIPYAEIREPFYAWFDAKTESSRIDYYGGMVKTYQLSKMGDHGVMRKVAPVTTEYQLNQETCLQVDGEIDSPIIPQSILPDLTGFEFIGEDMVNEHKSEKWRLVEMKGDKVNKYTMWIRYKKSAMDPSCLVTVPLRYEMRGFNSLLGSHYDHYYLEYDKFSIAVPDPSIFEIDSNMTCTNFPGPGDKHIYTFNPIREFVHKYDAHVDDAFEQFKRTHDKQYPDHQEHGRRIDIFRQNLRYIHSINRAGMGFQLGVNHLADKTELELKALRGRQSSPGYNGGKPFPYVSTESVPEFIDWRIYGAVAPVKDQSVCGSCWSFGTTGAIEGAYFMKYGHLVRISQQALIDCSWGYGNNGCDGGEDFRAYQWMMKHGGIPTEDEYGPYLGQKIGVPVHEEMRKFTFKHIHKNYPENEWFHVYADGSATPEEGKAAAGVYSKSFETSHPAGENGYNFDGEITAILKALEKVKNCKEYKSDGYCHIDNVTMTAKILGYVNVTSGDAGALKIAVAKHGPISVAIDASHKTFSFYANGVYYDPNCGNTPELLDHAVLVVGYGKLKGKDYWLVKNSWSNYWGNDGYILMAQQDNNCGVTTDPTYVIM